MNKVSIYSLNFCLDKLKITMQILTNLCLYTHSNPIVYVSHHAKCDIQYTIVIIVIFNLDYRINQIQIMKKILTSMYNNIWKLVK